MNPGADIFLIAGDPARRGRGSDPLLAGILSRIGLERPRVAYIGAASNDNRIFFLWISAQLNKAGAGSVSLVPLAARRAAPAKARALLKRSDVIFVSGGDVELGMGLLERSGMIATLKELQHAGTPFIGLSAGSIMLAQSWVRWPDAKNDASAETFPCLGLAPLLCDTHAEKEEWAELKVLLRLSGSAVGYGIPAGAALQVAADGSLAALGRPVQLISLENGITHQTGELKPI